MKLLQNWRIILIVFLVIWCIGFIHPFTKSAIVVTTAETPASLLLRAGDLIYSINGQQITSIDSFNAIAANAAGNESVNLGIERETFPYSYKKITYSYISNVNDNPLSFYVKEDSFSNVKFNAQLQGSNKFTIKTSDPDSTINILTKRFKIARIPDYTFQKQADNVILYTASGKEITELITTNGVFEARIGNGTFFTDKDITKYCISGVDCMVNTYAILNQTQGTQAVVWKYGFETHLSDDAAAKFIPLANNLSILKCEYDRCELNDVITFYIDDKRVGFENIYSTDKGKNMSMLFVGGEETTKIDALNKLHMTQAVLQGRTNAEIVSVEPAAPLLGERAVLIFCIIIGAVILANTVILTVLFRDIKTSAVSALLGISDAVIIFGFLAGLQMTITLLTMISIVLMQIFVLAYQNYSILWIKKEGLILRKVMELSSKLTKIFWVAIVVALVITMIKPDFGMPIIVYMILETLINKGLFFRALKAKEM